jgi:hypothetical protein
MPEDRTDRDTALLLVEQMRDKHLPAIHNVLNQLVRLDLDDQRAVEPLSRVTEAVEGLDEALRQLQRRLENQ